MELIILLPIVVIRLIADRIRKADAKKYARRTVRK